MLRAQPSDAPRWHQGQTPLGGRLGKEEDGVREDDKERGRREEGRRFRGKKDEEGGEKRNYQHCLSYVPGLYCYSLIC